MTSACPLLTTHRTSRYLRSPSWLDLSTFGLLAALRIVRRWNQTGQKFAGEPDIARTFLSSHTELLWFLITAAYLWNANSLMQTGFPRLNGQSTTALAITLGLLAITFKLAFTNEDAPELIGSRAKTILDFTAGWDLITRARIVFQTIAICLVFTIGCELFYSTKDIPGFRNSKSLYIPPFLSKNKSY